MWVLSMAYKDSGRLLPLTAEAAESIWSTLLRTLEGGSRPLVDAHYTICQVENKGTVVALVERSPEKAGGGGSIPSLATILNHLCFKQLHTFV